MIHIDNSISLVSGYAMTLALAMSLQLLGATRRQNSTRKAYPISISIHIRLNLQLLDRLHRPIESSLARGTTAEVSAISLIRDTGALKLLRSERTEAIAVTDVVRHLAMGTS